MTQRPDDPCLHSLNVIHTLRLTWIAWVMQYDSDNGRNNWLFIFVLSCLPTWAESPTELISYDNIFCRSVSLAVGQILKHPSLEPSSTRFLWVNWRDIRIQIWSPTKRGQVTDKKYQVREFLKQNFIYWTGFVVGKPPFMSPPNKNMLTFVLSLMRKKLFYGNKFIIHVEPIDNFLFWYC